MTLKPDYSLKNGSLLFSDKKLNSSEILRGPLNLVLHAGRLFGVAPVFFSYNGITQSTQLCLYSLLLIIICDVINLMGYIKDYKLTGTPHAHRTETVLHLIIWTLDLWLSVIASNYAVLTAPTRMKQMKNYMEKFDKIKQAVYRSVDHGSGNRRKIYILTLWTTLSLAVCMDIWYYINKGNYEKKDLSVMYMYTGYYVSYWILMMVQMQFLYVVVPVNDLVEAVNSQLKEIMSLNEQSHYKNNLSEKSCSETVNQLALTYNEIDSVMAQIGDAHGPILLCMLLIYLVHLVMVPFYLSISIVSQTVQAESITVMVVWMIFHLLYLVIAIEPCHRTQVATHQTRILISELFSKVSYLDPLYKELDSFSKQLFLSNNSYSLLQMTTLGRPLLTSILSTVTTYLLILIQFQSQQDDD